MQRAALAQTIQTAYCTKSGLAIQTPPRRSKDDPCRPHKNDMRRPKRPQDGPKALRGHPLNATRRPKDQPRRLQDVHSNFLKRKKNEAQTKIPSAPRISGTPPKERFGETHTPQMLQDGQRRPEACLGHDFRTHYR